MNSHLLNIDENTLIVTTPELRDAGIYMFTDTLKFNVDKNTHIQYIELDRFIVNSPSNFVNPHNTHVVNKFTEELKEKGKICLESRFEIHSLHEKELLVTLTTPNGLIEMVCQTLYPRSLSNPSDKPCLFNISGLKEMGLIEPDSPIYMQLKVASNFSFPSNVHVYKVEVRGHNNVKPYHLPCPGDGKWTPSSDIKTDTIDILYNYEDRVIMVEHSHTEDTGYGRRSSNGHVSYYNYYYTRGIRYFCTLHVMNHFFKELPSIFSKKSIQLKSMKSKPYSGNVFEYSKFYNISDYMTPKQLIGLVQLKFNVPISYNTLFEIFKMDVDGYYTWEEDRP